MLKMPVRVLTVAPVQRKVIELHGIPEFYADGAIFHDLGEVIRMIFFVEVGNTAESNVSIVLRRSGFIGSHLYLP